MKVLLDTHVLLWVVAADPRFSASARTVYEDRSNELFVSAASYWETAIKISIGRLTLPPDWRRALDAELARIGIRWLAIDKEHCEAVATLPFHHRDPFDRMLIAQAKVNGLSIMTSDSHYPPYGVPLVWWTMATERESDEALREKGLQILERELGPVDAMRFVALLSNTRFDYQEWRKKTFVAMSPSEIIEEAQANDGRPVEKRRSALQHPVFNIGRMIKPLGPDDDLLDEMLDVKQ